MAEAKPSAETGQGKAAVLDRRRAGLLLHPTSLPGGHGNGDLGPDAYRFVDFLCECGFTVWQMLPINPTHGNLSPYATQSIHAGSPNLISLTLLEARGWLRPDSSKRSEHDDPAYRRTRLEEAYAGFSDTATPEERDEYESFLRERGYWLNNYALFQGLKQSQHGAPWWEWPAPFRDRDATALEQARTDLTDLIEQHVFEQFLFFRQWRALKKYANERGVLLFGDMPVFVADNSTAVWARRHYFRLDREGRPEVVAGVPPDYFSATGQRWGNPHYNWQRMQQDDFWWWRERVKNHLELFDIVRVDHFRGFEAYWEIPASEPTAMNGRWVRAPGEELFATLQRQFHPLPLVAEDLGIITPEVTALRERFNIPGMKVLQFAFDGGADNPYLPHNHEANSVVYSGTHDNNTTLGWFEELPPKSRSYVCNYLGVTPAAMPWAMMRVALSSVSRLAVLTMQDILSLGAQHRMNKPGTVEGNWRWRFEWRQLSPDIEMRLRRLISLYGREV